MAYSRTEGRCSFCGITMACVWTDKSDARICKECTARAFELAMRHNSTGQVWDLLSPMAQTLVRQECTQRDTLIDNPIPQAVDCLSTVVTELRVLQRGDRLNADQTRRLLNCEQAVDGLQSLELTLGRQRFMPRAAADASRDGDQ